MINALLTSQPPAPKQQGFTLVELSVVLIVVGIIVGGLLVGRDLIRSTELKNLVEQRNTYITALTQFRERFNALPGDFSRATEIWGALNTDVDTCWTTPAIDARTCNGDGNGVIGSWNWAYAQQEPFRVWQHLSNAGLIEGRFIGVQGATGTMFSNHHINALPSNSGRNGHWHLIWLGTISGDSWYYDGNYSHTLIGLDMVSAREAEGLDVKFDDGKPATGKQRSVAEHECTEAANGTAAQTNDKNSVYAMSVNTIACPYIIIDIIAR